MTMQALIQALKTLKAAGWPLVLDTTSYHTHVFLGFLDEAEPGGVGVETNLELSQRDRALIMGWLSA